MSQDEPWYGVRCVFAVDGNDGPYYEERVTIWRAESFDEAVELAEADAAEYAATLDAEYLGLAQAFHVGIDDRPIEPGDEVFSLMRRSDLSADDYIKHFFAPGGEHQQPL